MAKIGEKKETKIIQITYNINELACPRTVTDL
jgi:hypothetical protein